MTCEESLTRMLSADLAELSADAPGAVGRHLTECARCRRVAAQLRADSARLATAVALPASIALRRSVYRSPWLVGAAATAAMAIAVLSRRGADVIVPPPDITVAVAGVRATPPAIAPTAVPEATTTTVAERPVVVHRPTMSAGEVIPDPAQVIEPVPFDAPNAIVATPFEAPTPVQATALHATPVLASAAVVTPRLRTMPQPNPNVTVLRSPDPAITVLWFN